MGAGAPAGFNYAALILPHVGGPPEPQEIVPGKETFVGRVSSLLDAKDLKHWREWLGTVAWERLDASSRIVIARGRTETPGVIDAEMERLRGRVSTSWRAFLLCDPDPKTDTGATDLTGEAASGELGSRLLGIRQASKYDRVAPLWFASRERFIRTVIVPQFKKEWEATRRVREAWFSRWLEVDRLLSAVPWPPILMYALLAHGNARTSLELEFAVPGLVRAAEGVLALPKGKEGGAKNFASRALLLVPCLAGHPYLDGDLERLLLELYEARNECVHGKVPFKVLQERGDMGIERAAQLAFVADVLARESLLAAFRFPNRSIFDSREALEEAWRSGEFPSTAA